MKAKKDEWRRGPKPGLFEKVKKLANSMVWRQAGTTQQEILAAARQKFDTAVCPQILKRALDQLVAENEIILTIAEDKRNKAFMAAY